MCRFLYTKYTDSILPRFTILEQMDLLSCSRPSWLPFISSQLFLFHRITLYYNNWFKFKLCINLPENLYGIEDSLKRLFWPECGCVDLPRMPHWGSSQLCPTFVSIAGKLCGGTLNAHSFAGCPSICIWRAYPWSKHDQYILNVND